MTYRSSMKLADERLENALLALLTLGQPTTANRAYYLRVAHNEIKAARRLLNEQLDKTAKGRPKASRPQTMTGLEQELPV